MAKPPHKKRAAKGSDVSASRSSDAHSSRVHADFDELHERLGERLDAQGREAMDRVREAAAARDGAALRKELVTLRDRHSWLYRELATHPTLANMIDELALLGL